MVRTIPPKASPENKAVNRPKLSPNAPDFSNERLSIGQEK
jgi:hypothetical protein